jgi:uncharacterized 2Fe-2S/4Fe-4S cluster protein (DUF4445 family)
VKGAIFAMYGVRVHVNGKIKEFKVKPGKNILEFLRDNSIDIPTPCGGKGTCGKCRVKVKGILKEPSEKEKALVGSIALDKGYRLACYNQIESDIEIFMDDLNNNANIVTSGFGEVIMGRPVITKKYIEMAKPDITDQRTDSDRVIDASGGNTELTSLKLIRELPELIREQEYKVTIFERNVGKVSEIIGIEPGDTRNKLYGMAVDIGTTTIAAYLYDLNNGKKLDVYSTLNPQKKFGADVLSRIDFTKNSPESQNKMHKEIIDCINLIVKVFSENNNIETGDIYTAVFVGNTTMLHFLMNISAVNIGMSPFIPVTTDLYGIKSAELDININKNGLIVIFPSVSAYIGADTIAAVLSTGMYEKDEISLLVDIGTNGEIVLGNKEWMYSCSTAAGPAFEGANIRNGVGGISGAIDRVYFQDKLSYTTIGNKKAVGICGSGIVDVIAGMLDKGIIDETGRIIDIDEYPNPADNCTGNYASDYKSRLTESDGLNSFILASGKDSNSGNEIAITQKDVRELQNAKAAIAAGIKTLLKHADISVDKISKVYLAGGFGNYINIESAIKIGLIPSELKKEKIESVGNAAGTGAIRGLLSDKELKETTNIKNKIKYIELSASREFVDEYVNCMFFL